jgi:hypothetical protein
MNKTPNHALQRTPHRALVATSPWPTKEQQEPANMAFVCAHFRTFNGAAKNRNMAPKEFRRRLKEAGLEWVPPLRRFDPDLPPPEWWLDLQQVMLSARRTGRLQQLPDWFLIKWVKARPELHRSLAAAYYRWQEDVRMVCNNQVTPRPTTRSV